MGSNKTPDEWDQWTARMKSEHANGNGHGPSLSIEALRLMPTPRSSRGASNTETAELLATPQARDHKGIPGDGFNTACLARDVSLLPTPRVKNNENRQTEGYGGEEGNYFGLINNPDRWGDYAAAIHRWEQALGRPAPEPTTPSTKTGRPQLSARFVEWLMGVDEGWITDVPNITRNEALKALGNGVVRQQASEALRRTLTRLAAPSETERVA